MTGAFDDNPASLGVTRALGYRPNGERWMAVEGQPRRELLFVLERDDWQATRRDDIDLHGVDAALSLFGAEVPAAPADSQVEGPAANG